MYLYKRFLSIVFAIVVLHSCKTAYQPTTVEFNDYKISQVTSESNSLTRLLKPYAESVNKNMNDVIAIAAINLEKRTPEGTLGNVLADAMLFKAREKYGKNVDASFINSGGIRLPSIAKGNITRGKIFELAPFDNLIVLLEINSKDLLLFLDLVAGKGGWPCAGITYQIKNNKPVNVQLRGAPLDENTVYTIALVDYIANGGDNCDMLKDLPQQNKGYLFRDAIIDYFTDLNNSGKTITSSIEKRVSNAD